MKTNLEQYGFKGTPGEWFVDNDDDVCAYINIHTACGYDVATLVDSHTGSEIEQANNKLIAKAPELAMALIEIYKAMYRTELGRGLNELVDSIEPLLKSIGVEI